MSSLNKVQLIGNLTRDVEVRYTGDGKAIANLNVATSETWKDASGQKQEKAEFHRVVIFGKLAEVAGQYLNKGSKLFLEGKLVTRKWTDKQGQEKYTTEIVVDQRGSMVMLGGKSEGKAPAQAPAYESPAIDDDFSDNIPF